MIRYVHIGNQIYLSDANSVESFAFFDTIVSRFVEFDGEQVFDTVEDLLSAYDADPSDVDINRLLALMPKAAS
jgi:hypothetical protein